MTRLDGRSALVTGASRGIGRAIAKRLAGDGAVVAVHYARDAEAADATVEEIHDAGGVAFAVQTEFGAADSDLDALFAQVDAGLTERLGEARLDILVNNAATNCPTTIEHTTPEQFADVFAVNVRDLFFTTQRALERMPQGGRIVNISSGATRVAFPEGTPYAMTKGAIDVLALTLAKHLGPRGITVNGVAPGIIDTDINAGWLRESEEARQTAAAISALGRVGQPEDVADVVAFLASDDGRWVTGRTIDATGGSAL
jgi:NAD(P)-dependent dehydrogenase (short-subunit alcohol dehydrogenase family)